MPVFLGFLGKQKDLGLAGSVRKIRSAVEDFKYFEGFPLVQAKSCRHHPHLKYLCTLLFMTRTETAA